MTPIEALQASALSTWLRQSALAYPVIESFHIIGLALVVGGMAAVDMAVLRRLTQGFASRLLPMVLAGFTVALITGSLMVLARPMDLLLHPVLWIKFGLLSLAATNAGVLHARNGLERLDPITRAQAALSLLLWVSIVFAGRWIAYA
jgi:hypothetical protein